ncbi:hypothetical protein R1sor_003972 [Riccia sorocarpa]|uniref:DDE Tnp4 domain-containing protein n=1 Tax=Riccia sorocarpa TaxID=122646 RepID=A0ABD3H370_9MARC
MPRVSNKQDITNTIAKLIEFEILMESSDDDMSLDSRSSSEDSSEEENCEDYDFDSELYELWLSLQCNHPIFFNNSNCPQTPAVVQLAVGLDRLGHEGNGACIDRSMELWGISHGSLVNFTRRVLIAIEDMLRRELQWPTPQERQRISEAFTEKGFPGCVGLIDGTLVELVQRPHFDGETYYDRKSNYSLNVQIVCDHRRRILFLYSGLPGSVQDITAVRRSSLWKFLEREESTIFGRGEYLLGNSGYVPLPHLVPAFRLAGTDREKSDFNNCLAHARVINEHCIGVLKSRWHSLKQIRTQLKCREENKLVIKWVKCCVLLIIL